MDGQAQKRKAGKEKTSSPWGQKIGMGIWLENKTKPNRKTPVRLTVRVMAGPEVGS